MSEFMTALRVEHARLSAYLRDHSQKHSGTLPYRQCVAAHRLLTDLIARDGGDVADRDCVKQKLVEIAGG